MVLGEISNLSCSSGGHWYLTLSDSQSAISAAVFKGDALRNPVMKNLKDGDKVICSGGIGVYGKRGTFQLIIKQIQVAGKGDLKLEFEKLKKKLAAEGLFDLENKKPIPSLAKRVAVITAGSSAAFQDFINIYERRSIQMDLMLVPAVVQGDAAPASLRNALIATIKYSLAAPKEKKIDVIVLTRGGGSLEDLWAFNDEALAWEIYNCPIPIISAVGHQVDFSISDFVADQRCETPSAAAETLTETQTKVIEKLGQCRRSLLNHMELTMGRSKEVLENSNPSKLVELLWSQFNELQKRLSAVDIKNRLHELTGFHDFSMALDEYGVRMKHSIEKRMQAAVSRLEGYNQMLMALGPKNVLDRGYSYVKSADGSVVANHKDYKKLKDESSILIAFSDGTGKAKVLKEE
ncbi:MAG: exodeoxyribonuclease VII large subunit [Bacteriovoracaceae bacterium]|jgi:exodeoxyribonuclease VII large subunit